ncbi:MAG: glycosyltransferase family 4 protein [candidate division NC10 bacterium]|nr:glycosyltransferase family 4 protein [candidate division NC10 bacterium]
MKRGREGSVVRGALHIAMLTPSYLPRMRGNTITVDRIRGGLEGRGHRVQVLPLEEVAEPAALADALAAHPPELLHAFHAFAAGPLAVEQAAALRIPAVVSVTGTDLNHDLFDPARRERVAAALRGADGVVVFHETMLDTLARELPEVGGKVRVIRQAVRCGEAPSDFRRRLGIGPEDAVFFLPAGIRRVKNLAFCLPPLTALRARDPRVKVVYAGPILEADEGERLLAQIQSRDWVTYVGEVSHEEICGMLKAVEVVVNSSLSEGGMSNALLEAMSRGVAVLAADIPGNRSLVVDGVDGFLFRDEADFGAKAECLLTDPGLRRRLGEAARAKVGREFTLEQEINGYEGLYADLLRG